MPTKVTASPAGAPSFRAIFEAEFSYVWNVLRRLGVHPNDVEDVGHDVFLVVHRHLASYDPSRPLRPWLFGICVRTVADHRRLARHRREVPCDGHDPPDEAPMADEALVRQQAQKLVSGALDVLDLDRRAILVLHDMEEQTMPTIAEALGIPLNTAYSRLRLARKDFADGIARLRKREASR